MTRETIQYKDLSVREPAPYGAAGAAWQANFKELADRIGPCNFTATVAPTANDDTGDGYAVGSLWYDTVAQRVYWCASAATGAAVWIEISSSATVAITGGTITGITDLAVADGGTGASDAATARTNLGLGTIATQAANSVAITGGAIDGVTIGATTAAAGIFSAITVGSDSNGMLLGASSDAQIYYNGTDLLINPRVVGSGNVKITAGNLLVEKGNIYVRADSVGLYWGAGNDAMIYYDGTNMIIDPDVIGTGLCDVHGTLQTDGYNSSDGTAGATADVDVAKVGGGTRTLTFKNGLYTGYTDS